MFAASLGVLALVLTSLLMPAPAGPPAAARQTPSAGGALYVEGEILLKFQPGVKAIGRSNAQSEMNAQRVHTFASGAEHWKLGPGVTVEDAVRRLSRNPLVAYAEPNYLLFQGAEPNDPNFPDQWALKNTGQQGGKVDADVDAELAWDTTTGSQSVIVAVLDTGVDYSHVDLLANLWTNPSETINSVDDDGNGYVDDVKGWDFVEADNSPSPYDEHLPPGLCSVAVRKHGTHVAGIVGAVGGNLTGVTGINWSVKIMNLRVIPGVASYAVAAVDYARVKGAQVINASWQSGGFSQTLYDAINLAGGAGITFVAAAMNLAVNIDTAPVYPASYDLPNIIAVASTDRNDLKSSFSNYGNESVDLGAPGSEILSTVPSWPDNQPYCGEPPPTGTSYKLLGGTSMATPLVAGTVALMRAFDPAATVAEMKCYLITTTEPLPSLIFRTVAGGRLNADRALDALGLNDPCTLPADFRITLQIKGATDPNNPPANLIALPYGNIFQGSNGPERLCDAFGLSNQATVTQYDGLGLTKTHKCGKHANWQLFDRKGIEIREPAPGVKSGVVEGFDDPNGVVRIEDLGQGTVGLNLFPVRYNGTAVTPQDLCTQCGLSGQAQVTRIDAFNGLVLSHVCGQIPTWNLVLGEAVHIQEPNGPINCLQPYYQ